jgi:zinc protease
MDGMKMRMAAIYFAALLAATAAPSLRAQDAPVQAGPQTKGTGQVPAGVTLSPKMPDAAAPRPFKFPKAITRTLENGLRVFVIPGGKEPSVTIRLVLMAAGTGNDPKGKSGVAHLAADLLTDGTATRSAQQIAEAIDFVGGSLSTNADADGTNATAQVVTKDFDLAMNLLADVTLHPAFQNEEIERRRQQLLSNFEVEYADANYLAGAVFSRLVYGEHPYGLPEEGTPASARRITREDLVRFRDERYVPNSALLAFAGDITAEEAFAAAEKYFGAWEKKSVPVSAAPPPPAAAGLHILVVDKPDAVQTQIRVGRAGIPRNHPDFLPLFVANRIFGGGFNSRLSTKVRQEKGLTYGAFSAFDSHKEAGSFVASTSTRTEATAEAAKLIVELIAEMGAGTASDEELKFARDYLVGVFPIQLETPSQVAGRALNVTHFDLPADYYETYRDRIMAMNTEQVKAISRRYFDAADLFLVLVGNAQAFRGALQKDFPGAKIEELSAAKLDLLAPDLKSESAATPETLAQGHAMIIAAAEAAGGEAISKTESVDLTGTSVIAASTQKISADVHIQILFPNQIRVDSKFPTGVRSQGFDGQIGWVSSPQGTQAVPAAFNAEFGRGIALNGGLGLYRLALGGQLEVQFAGQEEVQGKKLMALVWNSTFGAVKLYIDPAIHLVVATRYSSKTQQGSVDSLQIWDDFRAVEGVQYPFHAVTFRNEAKYNETNVQQIKLNTKPDPALFAMPPS